MFFRLVLIVEIVVGLLASSYTISTQAKIWNLGRQMSALNHRAARLQQKAQLLDVLVARVEMPQRLEASAGQMRLALVAPSPEPFAEALARLRPHRAQEVQFASNRPRARRRR